MFMMCCCSNQNSNLSSVSDDSANKTTSLYEKLFNRVYSLHDSNLPKNYPLFEYFEIVFKDNGCAISTWKLENEPEKTGLYEYAIRILEEKNGKEKSQYTTRVEWEYVEGDRQFYIGLSSVNTWTFTDDYSTLSCCELIIPSVELQDGTVSSTLTADFILQQ